MQVDIQSRNLIYNSDSTTIDMEINHPNFGWIPFTASPNDIEEHGKAIHQAAINGQFGPIAPYTP